MLNKSLIDDEYGFLGDEIFLNVSSVVMPPKRVQDAYRSFMDEYVENYGDDIVPRAWSIVAECREKVARLLHADRPEEIAFVKNTCEGISILADGYPWMPGDNVVVADQEHQANLFPWINAHQRHGITLHIAKSVEGEVLADEMIGLIDDNTRILAISAAQFSTGYFADLVRLGEYCHSKGIIFCVDAIQALGRLVIDVQKMHIDYLAAGSNKGLLGTLGAGLVYCSDRIVRDIIPPYASYQSVVSHVAPPAITTNFETLEWYPHARRFESGNLSYNCILAISKGVDLLLELDVKHIEAHIRELETHLRHLLNDLSLPVVQAKDPQRWSGIVCVYYPQDADAKMIEILKKHRIHATIRGGYIRFGINFYNTLSQMDRVSIALHEIAAQAKQR